MIADFDILQGSDRMTALCQCAYHGFPRKEAGVVPIAAPHYENPGNDDLILLEMFAVPELSTSPLTCIRNLPNLLVKSRTSLTDRNSMGYRTTKRQYLCGSRSVSVLTKRCKSTGAD